MPLEVIAQRTDEWLQARLGKITASIAAACLGWDPYISPKKAWRTILGAETKYENGHMRRGQLFEAPARLAYEAARGVFVEETGLWSHPALPWLMASPDGLIGSDGLLEIKCPMVPRRFVPLHHRVQCLMQLACTDRQWCDYVSYGAPDQGYFIQRIHRAGIPGLIIRLEAWYQAYVVTGLEPPRRKPK